MPKFTTNMTHIVMSGRMMMGRMMSGRMMTGRMMTGRMMTGRMMTVFVRLLHSYLVWFSQGTLVFSTKKTDCHDITEILLKVALNTIKPTNVSYFLVDKPASGK